MTGNLDLDGNRIIHLGDGSSDTDAVNLKQLKSHTDNKKQNYHLEPSFIFPKNFGDKSQLVQSGIKSHIMII